MHQYKFSLNNTYNDFENNNPHISLSVFDKYGTLLHQSLNNSNNKAHIVKMNDHRYNAIKPNKDKYTILNNTLKLFTHKQNNKSHIKKDHSVTLIEHSLLYGLISFFLHPILPYPGNDLIDMAFSFNILCALFNEISLTGFLLSLLNIHLWTVISTKSVFFLFKFTIIDIS